MFLTADGSSTLTLTAVKVELGKIRTRIRGYNNRVICLRVAARIKTALEPPIV